MKSLVKYFGCGGYYSHFGKNDGRKWGSFRVIAFSDISSKIIPFFQEYPIIGVKNLDYLDFCQVAKLMKEGRHLTAEGLVKIKLIKQQMNKGRSNSLNYSNLI